MGTDYLKVEDTFCSWQFHKFLLFVIIMSLKTVGNPMKTKTSETSEKDLVSKSKVTPDDVLALKEITDTYFCSPDANTFGIDLPDSKSVIWKPIRFCLKLQNLQICQTPEAEITYRIRQIQTPEDLSATISLQNS